MWDQATSVMMDLARLASVLAGAAIVSLAIVHGNRLRRIPKLGRDLLALQRELGHAKSWAASMTMARNVFAVAILVLALLGMTRLALLRAGWLGPPSPERVLNAFMFQFLLVIDLGMLGTPLFGAVFMLRSYAAALQREIDLRFGAAA